MRTMILLASALLMSGTIQGQETAQGRARTVERDARRAEESATELRERVMERVMVRDSAAMNRATLGLMLGGSPTKRDTLGVFVEGVAEDGPAERAGIYEGHRIAFINNVDVRASAADAGDPYLSSVGQHRLLRAMREVAVGSAVTLRVWTGSGYRDVQVTAARYADVFRNQRFGMFEGHVAPGAMSFRPALERMRIEAPMMREFHLEPSREVRIERRPGRPDWISTPRPTPSVEGTPRMIPMPSIAPVPAGRRRFVI